MTKKKFRQVRNRAIRKALGVSLPEARKLGQFIDRACATAPTEVPVEGVTAKATFCHTLCCYLNTSFHKGPLEFSWTGWSLV